MPETATSRTTLRGLTCLLAAALALAACREQPESAEAEIRAWVARGTDYAEAENRRGLVGMISPSYADGRGNNRDDLDDLFRLYFLRADNVTLITRIEDILVHGESAADLVLTVGMAGTNIGVLGFSADAYRFEMELERSGDDWRLIGARWGELGETPE